jgi:hypothetical protein
MSKIALADTLEEWDSLLAAFDDHPELQQPYFREFRDALAATIEFTKRLVAEQESLEARRQAVTQQLRITRGQGQDLVVKIRAALKSFFGHRWEGLAQFRIRLIRRRSRRASEEEGIAQFLIPDTRTRTAPAPEALGTEVRPAGESPEPAPREES